MQKNTIIVLGLVFVCLLFYMVMQQDGDKYNWSEWDSDASYQEKSVQPYGLQVVHQLAKLHFGARYKENISPGLTALEKADPTKTTYVFIGQFPYYDTIEMKALLTFAARGGRVFLAPVDYSDRLRDSIFLQASCSFDYYDGYEYSSHTYSQNDTVAYLQLNDPEGGADYKTEYSLYYKRKRISYHWPGHYTSNICEEVPWFAAGEYTNDSRTNFLQVGYGQGDFLLHKVPLVFTNLHMIRDETRPYINRLFGYMDNETVIWDSYARTDMARKRAATHSKGAKTVGNQGILSTMLREPALAFAWFILLGLVGMFLVFGSKREQRLIPVIPPPKNASLQFVRSLGRLQFREENYQSMCRQDMRYFLNTLRERTNIAIPMQANGMVSYDNKLLDRIVAATGFPVVPLRDIFTRYEACARYAPTGDMMTDLHMAIEQFIRFKKQFGTRYGR